MSLVAVTVQSVGLDPSSNTPLVVLGEAGGERALPIWIGPPEALSIDLALEGVSLERPLTHDLIRSLLEGLGATVERIVITEIRGGTFYAQIVLRHGDRLLAVDARPSDSIAVALRLKAPIFVDEVVMGSHGVVQPQDGGRLAERLKGIRPEDFGKFSL